jgi:hypothetical protein
VSEKYFYSRDRYTQVGFIMVIVNAISTNKKGRKLSLFATSDYWFSITGDQLLLLAPYAFSAKREIDSG